MADVRLVDRDVLPFDIEWPKVSGAAESAQNIVEALHTPIGSLPWDRTAGSNLPLWLNQINPPDRIRGELRRVALNTPGVIPASVVATWDPETDRYRLSFASTTSSAGELPEGFRPTTIPETIIVEPTPEGGFLLVAPGSRLLIGPGARLRVE